MIPNALARTGDYADFWSHLKSIDHALARALNDDAPEGVTDLDRERLRALAAFLLAGLGGSANTKAISGENLLASRGHGPVFESFIDLKQQLRSINDFEAWKSNRKMGVEAKVRLLIGAIESYTNDSGKPLLQKMSAKDPPVEEFKVLKAILAHLLGDVESILQAY